MAGPAIRAQNIADGLAPAHDVRLVSTAEAGGSDRIADAVQWCDVFVTQGWVLHDRLFPPAGSKVLVCDLYDPIHLEQLEQGKRDDRRPARAAATTRVLCDQLLRGDFFICASERQRNFWLGHLAALGRINTVSYDDDPTLRRLIDVVPFGVPADPPVAPAGGGSIKGVIPGISHDDLVVIWGGGIYDWFDPQTLLEAIDRVSERHPSVRLVFMGMRHPSPDVPNMAVATAARELAQRLNLTGKHVFFNEDWVPYEDRAGFLTDADIGVTTHLNHLETQLSFRTRVLDYFWAGLPVVTTDGDAIAELVQLKSAGLVVPPGDASALAAALDRLLDDAQLRATLSRHSRALATELTWPDVVQPLKDFCSSPRPAPDLIAREILEDDSFVSTIRAAARHLQEGGVTGLVDAAKARLRRRP